MAATGGTSVVGVHPEINLARRLLQKYKLTPPIDVLTLVQKYAKVVFKPIPVLNVDGVSVNIKVPGKKPIVVVNSTIPSARRLFTLAHELGHLIIPWHVGTIPDVLNFSFEGLSSLPIEQAREALSPYSQYAAMEREANRFAAELLMPEEWVHTLAASYLDLAVLHEVVCEQAHVSPQAACLRLRELLPAGIIYFCVDEDGIVSHAGSSIGTLVAPPHKGELYLPATYAQATNASSWSLTRRTYHWWRFPTEINFNDTDSRDWRTILAAIITEVAPSRSDITYLKQSINGVIGAAHGMALRNESVPYTEEAVIAACLHRMLNREDLFDFATHPDFKLVIKKRAAELHANRKKNE